MYRCIRSFAAFFWMVGFVMTALTTTGVVFSFYADPYDRGFGVLGRIVLVLILSCFSLWTLLLAIRSIAALIREDARLELEEAQEQEDILKEQSAEDAQTTDK